MAALGPIDDPAGGDHLGRLRGPPTKSQRALDRLPER
jgi:hypothetical protein